MLRPYKDIIDISSFLLFPVGLDPIKSNPRNAIYAFPVVAVIICDVTAALFSDQRDFESVVNLIISFSLTLYIMNIVVLLFWRRSHLAEFVRAMDAFWPVDYGNKDADFENGCLKILATTKWRLKFILAFAVFCSPAVSFLALYGSEFFLLRYIPKHMASIPVHPIFVELSLVTFGIFSGMGLNALFAGKIFLLWMQYKILNKTLSSVRYCQNGNPAVQEQNRNVVKNCAKHHEFLLGLVKRLSEIYGPMLLIHLWLHVFFLCLSLYVTSEINYNVQKTLKFAVMFNTAAMQIFVFCFLPAQFLSDEVNKVANNVYNSDWHIGLDLSLRKSVSIIMLRAQKETVITAGKLMPMSFETCTNLFKTIMSFRAFIHNMRKQ